MVSGLMMLQAGWMLEKSPEWSYETDNHIYQIDISEDGEYIVAGDHDGFLYLFS